MRGRIGTGNAHEREMTDVYAAGFPSSCSGGDGGRDARCGANVLGGWDDRQRNAQRRIDSGLLPRMDLSRLSLVRAARIGPWPNNELVPLAGAANPKPTAVPAPCLPSTVGSATTTNW